MNFTFIHTADWQLGRAFGALPRDVAPLVADARLTVIDRIAAVAETVGAQHVLVAGDVFDTVTVPRELLSKMLQHFAAHPRLTWHLLPGNHDPAQPGSLWPSLQALIDAQSWPVRLYLEPKPVEIEPGVLLLPAPLATRAMSTDPTAYMSAFESAPGIIRIGMAHGSAATFGTSGDANVPIDPARDRLARLDYLALGDWHGRTRISARTWYSGTPEPDRAKDNVPGHVLAVTVDAPGAEPRVESHATALFHWLDVTLDISRASDLAPLTADLRSRGAPSKPVLLDLSLKGQLPISEMIALDSVIADLRGLTKHLALDMSEIRPQADGAEGSLALKGSLAAIAGELAVRAETGDMRAQRIAARALQILVRGAAGSAT